jgi:hypothetical protein
MPYSENVCEPNTACLSESAACIAKLQAAMQAAKAAEDDLTAKAKLKNDAQATSEQKIAAAEAKKAEAEAAETALASAKVAFEVAEKEAATAKASLVAAEAASTEKIAAMNVKLAEFEAAKKSHLAAVAAYDGAESEAAQALVSYEAAIKAHCDAEAVHARAVTYIGHAHTAQITCTESPTASPTAEPTASPTASPTAKPTASPTPLPAIITNHHGWDFFKARYQNINSYARFRSACQELHPQARPLGNYLAPRGRFPAVSGDASNSVAFSSTPSHCYTRSNIQTRSCKSGNAAWDWESYFCDENRSGQDNECGDGTYYFVGNIHEGGGRGFIPRWTSNFNGIPICVIPHSYHAGR